MEFEPSPFSESVIGCAIEVHSRLGPGLLESAYEKCLMHEFYLRGVHVERQCNLPISYKGIYLDCGYRVDFIVHGALVLEIKTVDRVLPIHKMVSTASFVQSELRSARFHNLPSS